MNINKNVTGFGSLCVKDIEAVITTKPHQLPIYATSSFEFESIDQGIDIFTGKTEGHVYARYGNPGIDVVAKKIARLEAFGSDHDAWALMTSSGMSAISTLIMGLAKSGDKILTQNDLYGGTSELFNKLFRPLGISPVFVNLNDHAAVENAIAKDKAIKFVFFETPANPTLSCIEIDFIVELSKNNGLTSIIDNTFATPYLQQPLKSGIDYVIHSTTKYINGHGNSIAGVIIGTDLEGKQKIWAALKLAGTNSNAWDAWLTNNGMRTLALRMDRHCSNAMQVAEFLAAHEKITHVNYPGLTAHASHEVAKKQMKAFGGMLSFEIQGGMEAGITFMNKIQFCTLAPTLGDVDSLIVHPASSSHLNIKKEIREAAGISDGMVRLSVGIESVEDIIYDLEQALG